MRLNRLLEFLDDELSYPIDQASVIEQIGEIEIEAPDATDTLTVGTIIESVGQETYGSAEELSTTIVGNLSDEYIGRKFYDDRGGNPPEIATGRTDEADLSF